MSWFQLGRGKSGKREVAVALLMLWAFITCYIFFWISPDDIVKYRDVFGTVTVAIIGFATGAFGLDAYFKLKAGAPAKE